MRPLVLFPAIVLWCLLIAVSGCRPAECQQMLECCEEVEDLEAAAGPCQQLGPDASDPQTCRDVTRTIGYMLEDRDRSVPAICEL